MGPGNEADRHLVNVRVPIDELLVGMFVEAGVKTLYREGEMRHFLEPTDATYLEPTSKRLRLMKKKIELVTTSGGMLLGSRKQIAALKQISISEVVVNTDKSDILPGSQTASAEPDPPPKGKAETEAPRRPSPPQRVDIAGTERRRNFGPSNSGWMKLEVIETDGDIAVEGSVEGGAVIQSQENVVIEKGIIGHGTRVVAQGSVSARFVHGSTVITAGDVTSTHLMNATVRARNLVVNDVEGDAKAGSIVVGQTLATGKVEASRAGSPTSEQTRIAIINDPELQAQMTKLDKGLEFCRTNILRILRTLGVREIDAVKLKELIDKAPPEKRKPLIKILTQLKQLVDTRDKSTKRRQTLAEEQEELFAEAEICIRGLVHADVQVQIGERAFSPKDDITVGAVFERTAKGISWSPPETE